MELKSLVSHKQLYTCLFFNVGQIKKNDQCVIDPR